MRTRGFEKVKYAVSGVKLPTRSDNRSAGYDFYSNEDVVIPPNSTHVFDTQVKAYMPDDEYLALYVRSSIGIKKNLHLLNTVGICDSSYYSNQQNDGSILIALRNYGYEPVEISKGERIAQGIFCKYYTTDDDKPLSDVRTGGIGSSGE